MFGVFKQTSLQFLQQINLKKCYAHPVYGAGIPTHNLLNMSRLPLPLDQIQITIDMQRGGGVINEQVTQSSSSCIGK